jgi:hypothetical protein
MLHAGKPLFHICLSAQSTQRAQRRTRHWNSVISVIAVVRSLLQVPWDDPGHMIDCGEPFPGLPEGIRPTPFATSVAKHHDRPDQ